MTDTQILAALRTNDIDLDQYGLGCVFHSALGPLQLNMLTQYSV